MKYSRRAATARGFRLRSASSSATLRRRPNTCRKSGKSPLCGWPADDGPLTECSEQELDQRRALRAPSFWLVWIARHEHLKCPKHFRRTATPTMKFDSPKLRLSEKVGYGFGDVASCLFWQTFAVYLANFYTDIFGIAASA